MNFSACRAAAAAADEQLFCIDGHQNDVIVKPGADVVMGFTTAGNRSIIRKRTDWHERVHGEDA
jgi:hypothetical protein